MGEFLINNPAWLWALFALPVVLIGPLRRPAASRRGAVVTGVLRCVVLTLLAAALADVRWSRPRVTSERSPVMIALDRSGSVANDAAVDTLRDRLLAGIPAYRTPELTNFATAPWRDGGLVAPIDQTDIERVLDSVSGTRGDVADADVVVLTDGRETRGDAAAAAARLAARGARVHVLPVGKSDAAAVSVVGIEPPADAKLGSPAAVRVNVRTAAPTPVTIELKGPDGWVVGTRSMTVDGEAAAVLRYTPDAPGLAQCSVTVRGGNGPAVTKPAAFDVEGPPRLLVVDASPEQASALATAAGGLKLPVDTVAPAAFPDDLSPYAAVVLSDMEGAELTPAQRLSLKTFVEDRGSGLVFVGGANVKADRWQDNPLGELLPVRFRPPPKKVIKQPPPVSVCFVIDTSGSMGEVLPGTNPVSKLALVKQAILASLTSLPPEAHVSLVAFDFEPKLVLDAASVKDSDLIGPIVNNIGVGGGTIMYPGIAAGLQQLATQPGEKFIIVLTDGNSQPPPGGSSWPDLTRAAAVMGAQWTSVAVGPDADQDLLRDLAMRAKGTFKYCGTSDDVPRVFIDQAKSIRRVAEQNRMAIKPTPGPDAGDLVGFTASDLPPLHGQVLTEAKGGSRVLLNGEGGRPLLATWQAGAGRVVTFASDAKTRWADAWLRWPDFGKFWAAQVGTVAFAPPPLRATVRSQRVGDHTRLTFTVTDEQGRPAPQLRTTASSVDGRPVSVTWREARPGVYEALARTDSVTAVRFNLARDDKRGVRYVATLAGTTTTEYALVGPDLVACQAIAAAGGGVCSADPDALLAAIKRPPVERHWVESVALWPYFLALALLAWPVDVWVRKIVG